jgi:UDP-N-acetylglucosamine:LPS N-acetylglucosamine transferase
MKKVIFAMIETGGGHKAPAKAVMEALRAGRPGSYDLQMIDFYSKIGCTRLDQSLKESWNFLLMHPFLTHFLYQIQDSFGPVSRAILYRIYVTPAISKAIRYLKAERPDAIFSTHYLVTELLVRARRKSGLQFKLFTYQTEIFTYHAAWKVPGTDWYITSSKRAELKAAKGGMPQQKLRTYPYPILPTFLSSRRDLSIVRGELGLDPSRKTVLFSFGNQGASAVLQYLLAMELFSPAINVIVATGRNTGMKKRIDSMRKHFQRLNLIAMGYANNMNELIGVSDVCFIKPGPATMLECMHSRKPIIFSMAATPCEQEHANFAVARGVAKETGNSVVLFTAALRHFMKDETLRQVAQRYDAMSLPNGAGDIADFVDQTLSRN